MIHFCKHIIINLTHKLPVLLKKRRPAGNDTFEAFLRARISAMEQNLCLHRGKHYALNSIANYRKLLGLWPHFEADIGVSGLRMSDITIREYTLFMQFCDSRGYRDSTKYQYAALLKSIMNCAVNDGVSSNTVQNSRGFVTRLHYSASLLLKKVYLTRGEIDRLAALDLKDCSTMRKVRDVFLVGCWTGQRFSDYSRVSDKNIDTVRIDGTEHTVLRLVQKKTGRRVTVPVMDKRILRILEYWGGRLPEVSISTLNTHIKTLCREAGIDTATVVSCIKGGKVIEEIRPKYEAVSSHTARRSCITNLYLEGRLSPEQIRHLSGHAGEKSFRRYLCQNEEDELKGILRNIYGNAPVC